MQYCVCTCTTCCTRTTYRHTQRILYAIVARRKITLTTCTAPCIYLVVILCFQFFSSPFCSYTHDLPRGIIALCIHIITLYARDCLRVSVMYYYIVCVYADPADVCSGITILNVPAGSTNPSSTNCRLLLSKYASSVCRLLRKSRADDRPGALLRLHTLAKL